ncbi:MAG TPA: 4Fe-4S dicluster domain-containing protein [Chloroflexi bacterium]|nr:4Fe-4S dicluster domain-containing protein [Chloroflexota bacterium]
MTIDRAAGIVANFANVSQVYDNGLCMGCGMCESICPSPGAITIRLDKHKGVYSPVIDPQHCTQCGLCLRVCPGIGISLEKYAEQLHEGQHGPRLIGIFNECYVGHATDEQIRFNSASGGLVTALLLHAIKENKIDGALVVGMSSENPLETQSFLATTPTEIISASGSKYCPVSLHKGLDRILAEEGRFAVVGLPCQIHAIRKMETLHPTLREKIVLHLGIFCANSNTYWGTEYFLRRSGIDPREVRAIRYRSEGWPGKISVTLSNGTKKIMPRGTTEKRWYRRAIFSSAFHFDFMIPRCLLCPDQTCELADISLGDPWLKEYTQTERIGKSIAITRNSIGHAFLTAAVEANKVSLEKMPVSIVAQAQNYGFKAGVGARIRLRQWASLAIPDYGERDLTFTKRDISAALRYLPSYFSHLQWLWPLIHLFAVLDRIRREFINKSKAVVRFGLRRMGLGQKKL